MCIYERYEFKKCSPYLRDFFRHQIPPIDHLCKRTVPAARYPILKLYCPHSKSYKPVFEKFTKRINKMNIIYKYFNQ